MAGKRLAAAGTLVAAVAATAALWVAPQASLAAQSRTIQSRLAQSRLAQSRLAQSQSGTTQLETLRDVMFVTTTSPVALSKPRSATRSPVVGLTAAGAALVALALVGVAGQRRRRAVPVRARTPYRGRAPPSRLHINQARMRDINQALMRDIHQARMRDH